jgi:hypothetical protein
MEVHLQDDVGPLWERERHARRQELRCRPDGPAAERPRAAADAADADAAHAAEPGLPSRPSCFAALPVAS